MFLCRKPVGWNAEIWERLAHRPKFPFFCCRKSGSNSARLFCFHLLTAIASAKGSPALLLWMHLPQVECWPCMRWDPTQTDNFGLSPSLRLWLNPVPSWLQFFSKILNHCLFVTPNCFVVVTLLAHRKLFGMADAENWFWCCQIVLLFASGDEYVFRIPNPKHTPKYTWAKVPHTEDAQLSSWAELCCCPIKSLAAASLPEYVDTHSLTGYLHPKELDTGNKQRFWSSFTAWKQGLGNRLWCVKALGQRPRIWVKRHLDWCGQVKAASLKIWQAQIQDFGQGGSSFDPKGALSQKFSQKRGFSLKIAWKLRDFEQILGAKGGRAPMPPPVSAAVWIQDFEEELESQEHNFAETWLFALCIQKL